MGNMEKRDLDIKGKTGIDCRFGIRCSFYVFGISASYIIPLNKKQEGFTGEDGYFKLGLYLGI